MYLPFKGYAFAGVTDSLINAYVFMLGGFDATAFKGLPISDFSLLLIVIFTVNIIRFFS
jgi:hypothetical protein